VMTDRGKIPRDISWKGGGSLIGGRDTCVGGKGSCLVGRSRLLVAGTRFCDTVAREQEVPEHRGKTHVTSTMLE